MNNLFAPPVEENFGPSGMPAPRFEDCLTDEELYAATGMLTEKIMDIQQQQAEIWAEGAWLRHAESLGWEEVLLEERYRMLGF